MRDDVTRPRYGPDGPSFLFQPLLIPELEHQQRPERLAVVADSFTVLVDPPRDLVGAEQALALEVLAPQVRIEQGGQGAAQPARHGDAEPLLAATEDRRGEPARRRALEQSLGA